jgi:TPR repeat protein
MLLYRFAALFLALAWPFLSPGSATAGWYEGHAAYERGDYQTAFREFMALAVAGDSSAQVNIGTMYASGWGVPQDHVEAVRWYGMAADQGNATGQINLGAMYGRGQGVPQNYAEAARWYRMAAEQGEAIAQNELGSMYHSGLGVPQDYAEAARWYIRAAEQGDAEAQNKLGAVYARGEGVRQDFAEAARWFRRAADQGHANAQHSLGAMYGLGQGVPQNYAEAARWQHMAADQGHANAQFSLGAIYHNGWGVPQDYSEAVRWYLRAAEQGEAGAQITLGLMHAYGEGVPQNYAEAARWYLRAAEQGDAEAQDNLGAMYARGEGVRQDFAEAARWFRRAANQGHGLAQSLLGLMYAFAQGVPQDYIQAYMWLNLAAARLPQGEERSQTEEVRDRVAAQLSPGQRVRAQEMARNWRPESQPAPQVASPPRALTDEDVLGKSAAVEDVQAKLAALGYDPGPADGMVGWRTRAAIWAFQADVGLPVDGKISDRLIAALSDTGAGAGSAPALTAAADLGREGADAKPWERYADQGRLDGTGTGFAVSERGQIVTNHHVVAECAEVRVRPPGQEALAGAVVAQDTRNDLALLRAPVRLPVAAIRDDGGIRAGDSVVAVGFPLPGLLASEANVTTGTVSALAGVGNDTRFLQMTVPVQPGNSGGPLLDLHGRLVGVVVGKLDALEVASVTGDIPQNVNFAIKASVVRSFLDASGVAVPYHDPLADPAYPITLSPAAVGADAKAFTVMVECWK